MLPLLARTRQRGRGLLTGASTASRAIRIGGAAACLAACAAMAAIPAGQARHHRPGAARAAGTRTAGVTTSARATVTPDAISAGAILVTSLRDAGPGTLRAAISRVNAGSRAYPATIRFTVRGVITLASALPAISRPVTIDATSAPGHTAGGPPVVEVNAARRAGLRFAAGSAGSRLLGLSVVRARGTGVTLNARSVTLDDDYVGLDLAGARAGNGGDGVYVSPASWGDVIGLNPSSVSGAVANVISANAGSGIVLAGSHGSTVAANRIGTNPAGTAPAGNGRDGIAILSRATGNEIGGTAYTDSATGQVNNPTGTKGTVTPVFVVPPDGNLVSGNGGTGVLIAGGSAGNVLNGNFIGTSASGDSAIGNGGDGVWIDHANRNSLTGCKFVNNPFVYYNVVSGNRGSGLRVTSASRTVVQGDFFGAGANNTAVVGNRLDGILVNGSSAGTQVGGVIPLGNVSSGNGRNGIEVAGRARGFTTFNTFGGLLAFKGAAPNRGDGLLITSSGRGNLVRTNVFSGNDGNGMELGGRAAGVTVDPDIAGLTTKGNAALPNGGDGLLIDGWAHGNVIGGTLRSVIPKNTLSGNRGYGLVIAGHASGNRVFRTNVGTEVLGTSAVANGRGGVLLTGSARGNTVGYLQARPANLVSGNAGPGVTLRRGTRGNRVISNYIGLDRFGRPLPNRGAAVINQGTGNVVAGNRY